MEVTKNNRSEQASCEIPPKMGICAKIPMVGYMVYKMPTAPHTKNYKHRVRNGYRWVGLLFWNEKAQTREEVQESPMAEQG